jgi:SAM-dependent methyltransferase
MKQQFSVFHELDTATLREWHAPYSALFNGASKVVDLGCGAGIFLTLLEEAGVQCIGLDIDAGLIEQLKTSGHSVFHATHEDLLAYAQGCDGIHISHVIEHLWGDEMKSLLEDCVSSLVPNGLLVIRTPNWSNKHVAGGGFWDDYTHKRPYSLRQLEKMLVDMGMKITASGHEPFGWEDTFIVARKEPVTLAELQLDQPIWPPSRLQNEDSSLKVKIQRKLKLLLVGE